MTGGSAPRCCGQQVFPICADCEEEAAHAVKNIPPLIIPSARSFAHCLWNVVLHCLCRAQGVLKCSRVLCCGDNLEFSLYNGKL